MDSEMTELEKQLMDLRALTAVTGVIHEAQKQQIALWGKLSFDYTTWQAAIDVESKTVIFTLAKGKRPKHLANLVAGLDRSVHWLLGPDWALWVMEGQKALYQGARARRNVNEERKQRIHRTGSGGGGTPQRS
jgi:hypothetical protein